MHLGIFLTPKMVSFGCFVHGRYVPHLLEMPEADLHTQAGLSQAFHVLENAIGSVSGWGYPYLVITMPYMSLRDRANIEQILEQSPVFGGVRFRCVSCISTACLGLVDRCPEPVDEHNYVMMISRYGHEWEIAIADVADGIVIMSAVHQWPMEDGTKADTENLRENIYKLIDASGISSFRKIFVTENVDGDMRAWLYSFFRLPCERVESSIPLYGASLIAAKCSGEKFADDVLLLDCTEYQMRIGTETLVDRGTTFPLTQLLRIPYNTARPDQSMDVYFFRDQKLESPLYIRPKIAPLIRGMEGIVPLAVSVKVDHEGRLSLFVQRETDGGYMEFAWPDMRSLFLM